MRGSSAPETGLFPVCGAPGILTAMASVRLSAPWRRIAAHLILLFAAMALSSACAGKSGRIAQVPRQNLFSISIGRMEDQLDLVPRAMVTPSRLSLFMRNGIFFIADGQGRKLMEFSSYGDILSLIYDPETNPEPVLLSPEESASGFRRARAHPFREIGALAVSSRQEIFIEDHLPPERRVSSEDGAILDAVVLRFGADGAYQDYIGQEGLGGTPFANIVNLHCGADDDLVVISSLASAWQVFWFSSKGSLISSLVIGRDQLPLPAETGLIPSLDGICPDQDSRLLYLKVDYAREIVDPATGASSGLAYDSSILWMVDPATGEVSGSVPILPAMRKTGGPFAEESFLRPWSLIGSAVGRNVFFRMPEEDGSYTVMVLNASTASVRRFSLKTASAEEVASAFHLDRTGILSALLVGRAEAKLVWWRLDRVIGEMNR